MLLERARHRWIDRSDRPRLDAQPLEGDSGRRRAVERPHPGQCFIEHTPSEYRSERGPISSPSTCSGLAYCGGADHPAGRRAGIGRRSSDPEVGDAYAHRPASIRMLAGLMSRWMMPCSWA